MNAEQTTAGEITAPLPPDLLHKMNAYWRAANYLSVGRPGQ
jgi:xylulose-5-phosphate/fructose-6-phosphate phosphoketolase